MVKIPLRLRLTLVYGLILGVAFAIAAILTHALVGQNLQRELDDNLSVRASALHQALNVGDDGFDIAQLTTNSLHVPVNEFAVPGTYIQVVDEHGRLAVASANLQGLSLPIDPAVIADGLAAKPSLLTLAAEQSEQLRVLTTPMIHRQHVVGLLQVAASLHTINIALSTLGYQLALGVAGSWLLTLLLVWWVVGRALRPVVSISSIAERIGTTGDVGQRITYDGARDELGELAATFNRMLDRIQSTLSGHRQFVADASHQLGTPLTVIRGNAELMAQDLSLEDRQECILAIRTEVERMDRVVGDLLTLAQLEARPALASRRVRLDALTHEVVGQVRSLAGRREIIVFATQPLSIRGDPDQLAELLLNLLHNSIKYSNDGTKITVRVETGPASTNSPAGTAAEVRLVVVDEGVGIPSEDIAHIFDRFYRVNRAYPNGTRGAGLGLAIVKAIADAHEGSVSVRSELGAGSKFVVTFPLHDRGSPLQAPFASTGQEIETPPAPLTPA